MRTNSKQVKSAVKNYIKECINDVFESEDQNKTEFDFMLDYYRQTQINKTQKMTDYDSIVYTIQGIYRGFDFTDYNIHALIDEWVVGNKYNDTKKIELFYHLIARESLELFEDLKKEFNKMNISDQLIKWGIAEEDISNHYSDLYVKKSFYSEIWLNQYEHKNNVTIFTDNIDKTLWYDIPFGFMTEYIGSKKA